MSDVLKTDVLIIGAGIAGLACAIRLAQENSDRQILILEKAPAAGAHILSGALSPREVIQSIVPEAFQSRLPAGTPVKKETFAMLFPRGHFPLSWTPPAMSHETSCIYALGEMVATLAAIAQEMGVEILFSQSADAWVEAQGEIIGIRSGEEEIHADAIVLAEGACGSLAKHLPHFENPANPQTYGLGIKEIIEVPACPEQTGHILHTFGAPLPLNVYGGGFLYPASPTRIALGLVIGLDYARGTLDPHELFRRWKKHPFIQKHIVGGKSIAYGAHLIPEGGWKTITPSLTHGRIHRIGDAAGLVDPMRLQGIPQAIASGQAAAGAILNNTPLERDALPVAAALRQTQNYRAAFRRGLIPGILSAGLGLITRGRLTLAAQTWPGDAAATRNTSAKAPPSAPEGGPLDHGMDSDLFLSNIRPPQEGTSSHIHIQNPAACDQCKNQYAAPCQHFCPARVYLDGDPLLIQHENCLQCRACNTKCPFDNITWQIPPHGTGPVYPSM